MGRITDFSNGLVTVMSAIQQEGAPAFAAVLDYATNQFPGYPACTILPADITSEYASVISNRRSYAFEVAVIVSVANVNNMETEFPIMRELADYALDAIDKGGMPGETLSALCNFVVPVPMKWQIIPAGSAGQALALPIHVSFQIDVDLIS